jgi:hypothetical protein
MRVLGTNSCGARSGAAKSREGILRRLIWFQKPFTGNTTTFLNLVRRLIGTTTHYWLLPGHNFQNGYTHDAASNRKKKKMTGPDGSTNTYIYDALNRLATLTNSLTGNSTSGGCPASPILKITRSTPFLAPFARSGQHRLRPPNALTDLHSSP